MINIFEPNVASEAIKNLSEVFESKWLGRGQIVDKFEERLASVLKTQRTHLATLASCSDAIFGAPRVFGLNPDDEVIVPTVSFPAIGSAIIEAGLKIKIVDIDRASGNISIDEIGKHLTSKTRGIFLTHYGGVPVNLERVRQVVGKGVLIFEDAACALGSNYDGVPCGTGGDFGCWSFDAMKLVTCGEGGAMFFSDPDKCKIAKEYFYLGLPIQTKSGIDRSSKAQRWWEYDLNRPGRRSIFTNVNAAIGLPGLSSIEHSLERRAQIRNYYSKALDDAGIHFLRQDDNRAVYSNYFFTVVSQKRDLLASYLKSKEIYSTFRYFPLHKLSLYREFLELCPQADIFAEEALNIPIHQNLSDSDVEKILETILRFHSL